MNGYEEQLLTRAEVLEDTGELVQAITAVLAGAQGAGADPAAVTGLQAAARALDPGAETSYDAGSKDERHPGTGYRSDGELLEAVSGAEDDVRDRLREAERLQETVAAAMDAAQAALAAAYAMPVNDECDGCHGAREAAIQAALGRIRTCEAAGGILDPLTERLQAALARLRQVPEDLGEVYELVYAFIRKGGKLPVHARWIEGQGACT
jgi:PAS domain-containing protein